VNEIKVIQSEPGKEIIVRVMHSRLNEDAWIGLFPMPLMISLPLMITLMICLLNSRRNSPKGHEGQTLRFRLAVVY